MEIDIQKIEELLAQKNYDEVRKMITAIVDKKFSDEEKGAALVGLASIYLDISNSIQKDYRDALQEAIAGMQKLNSLDSEVSDKIKLNNVRESLNS